MINVDDEISLSYLLDPAFELVNTAGKPLTDGWIEVYIHGTRNKYYCAKDFDGTLHEFKIPLDSLGANIILASPAHAYDVYVYNKFGSLVMSRYNVVPATGDGAVIKDVVTIKSEDGTVDVTTSNQTDWNLSIKDTVDKVEANTTEIGQIKEDVANTKTDLTNLTEVVNGHTTEIGQIKEDVAGIESALANKKDKQSANTFTGSATKTIKNISQNANGELTVEFEDIDLPQEVPNVEITSEDNSVKVTETTDVQTNTKKFDLSVNVEDPLEYGQFRATNVTSQALLNKVQGNLELNNYTIKLKKGNSYHFTVRGSYVATNATNTSTTIHYIEYSSFTPIQVNVDNTITDAQFFEISYDVYNLSSDKNYNVSFSSIDGGKVSELWVEVHNLNGVSVNGQGGGSGTAYSAGDAIDLTNDTISVKYGKGLEITTDNKLQLKVGKGLTFDDNYRIISSIGNGIYLTADGKLTTEEPEDNFIDITNEWEFDNGFRLQYKGATPGEGNDMRILYSPVSDTVKFTSACRINRTTPISVGAWNVLLRYKGNRFYTSHDTTNSEYYPKVSGGISGSYLVIGTDMGGATNSSLLKLAYVGSANLPESDTGLAIQTFINNSNQSTYGAVLSGLILKVTKKI